MPDSFAEWVKVPQGDGTKDVPERWPFALWAWSQHALDPVIFFLSHRRLGPGLPPGWSLPLAFALYNLVDALRPRERRREPSARLPPLPRESYIAKVTRWR